jgi:hypothetical protein
VLESSDYGVLTRRRVIGWVCGALGLVAFLSFLVGYFASREEGFDWELAAIFGTALGTTALAGVTGTLAFATSGDVRATWELADLTRRDQQGRERPLVIQQDARFEQLDEPRDEGRSVGLLRIKLRNVGLGPALRIEVFVRYEGGGRAATWRFIRPTITPDQMDEFSLRIRFQTAPTAPIEADGFKLSGTYLDRSLQKSYDLVTDWGKAGAVETGGEQSVTN